MARMSGNDESSSRYFGGGLKLKNRILDLVATCHMTPQVYNFIPGSLEDTGQYIEVSDGHQVTAKQKGKVQIKMCNDYGNPFIATFHNVLLAPDLCNRLFFIVKLMNLGHICSFKGFCKYGYYDTYCTEETYIFGKNKGKV